VLDSALRLSSTFITDQGNAISFYSPVGRYPLRFEDIVVRDAIRRVPLSLAGASRLSLRDPLVTIRIHAGGTLAWSGHVREARLDGVPSRVVPPDRACRVDDTRKEGPFDLLCDFDARALHLAEGRREFSLVAVAHDGPRFRGRLAVNVVR